MRELTVSDLKSAVSRMRSTTGDPVEALVASKRLRVRALLSTMETLDAELRVIECFVKIRAEWSTLPCRNKLRHVLGHGVAFAPGDLAALLGHKAGDRLSVVVLTRSPGPDGMAIDLSIPALTSLQACQFGAHLQAASAWCGQERARREARRKR